MDIDINKMGKVAMLAQRAENDGEQLSAFRTLLRMLGDAGLTLTDVLEKGIATSVTKPATAPAFNDIFASAMASAFGQDGSFARAQKPSAKPQPVREESLPYGKLPARFTGRFEILQTGSTKTGKPMAQVKVILDRTAEDVARNIVRIAFPNVFGDLALELADLEGCACEITSRPGTGPYPDTLTSVAKSGE